MPATGLQCALVAGTMDDKVKDAIEVKGFSGEFLKIFFQRIIRVSDKDHISELPSGLGEFPLYSVANYKNSMPADMALKGGLFLPMYQREAMWIRFESNDEFAIKVFVGAINAISGEPAIETAATRLRRLNLSADYKSVQDYITTPDQLWLDGIASTQGRVRQFVAMSMGFGYTVEAQVTGEDVTGGLQFEVTSAKRSSSIATYFVHKVFVQTLTGKTIPLSGVSALTTVEEVKDLIQQKEGISSDQQRLVHCGKQLCKNSRSLSDYKIPNKAIIHLILRLRGGGLPEVCVKTELGVAAGGYIKQCILPDHNPASIWERDQTIYFNVQILNSAAFQKITGLKLPKTPVSAAIYASHGLPFFQIYNEKSDIEGNFKNLKSVKAIDKTNAKCGSKQAYGIDHKDDLTCKNPIVMLDFKGIKMRFRSVSELESELSRMNAVRF